MLIESSILAFLAIPITGSSVWAGRSVPSPLSTSENVRVASFRGTENPRIPARRSCPSSALNRSPYASEDRGCAMAQDDAPGSSSTEIELAGALTVLSAG